MASSIPHIQFPNVGSGYTILNEVIPSSTTLRTSEQNSSQTLSSLQNFLKGEPKALGTVQIMIGVMTILFGIVIAVNPWTIGVFCGVVFWSSLLHITAGSLAVSASNRFNACVVKATLVINILSTIAAGIAIIMLGMDLGLGPLSGPCLNESEDYSQCSPNSFAESRTDGITGVLLVYALLQFAVSIAVSAFSCKAVTTNDITLNIISVIPNAENAVPVACSFPAYQTQQ
ncbi:membrane-spanning 4-domains subfamily A member 4A-like, partial [Clarias magur]